MFLNWLLNLLSKIFLFTGRIGNKNAFAKPLTLEEETKCFEELKNGNKEAEEKLIKHNLRLVAHIVKKYNQTYSDQDELISVGSIGLLKAVKSYDKDKGHSFSTYASRCIQNEILMLLRSQKKFNNEISIDEKIGVDKDGNEISLIDILQDTKINIEEKAENSILLERVIKYIDKNLSQREKEVLYLRYGLDGGNSLTQNEVAKILNISRSYISRIEKKAIHDIKSQLINRD